MQQMTLAKIKTNFSSVIKDVEGGEEVVVLYGKRKQPIAKIVPIPAEKKKKSAAETIGCLAHWGPVWFAPDYKMTEEELIGEDDRNFKVSYVAEN
jgi:antitoxin (DNA-binding transcriptional repressor) of toxin-antitoxin stability system